MKLPSKIDFVQLQDAPLTPIMIGGLDMLALLGLIQLVLRHPGLKSESGSGSGSAIIGKAFAEELEKRIVEAAPGLKDLCEAGWNPEHDT